MNQLNIRVHGTPAPQGSKRHVGGGVMVESSKKVKPWRQDVVTAALEAATMAPDFTPFTGPVRARITFVFPRLKGHFGTGRNAGVLKASAPILVATKPDLDKLVRSTFDALSTAGIWRDDNQAAKVVAEKVYGDYPGAIIDLTALAVTD